MGATIVSVRQKTQSQYRNAVAAVFGEDIEVSARFEPETWLEGLLAIGANSASISANGLQQYVSAAESVARQAVDPKRRDRLGCSPAEPASADVRCSASLVADYGRRLLGRPLSPAEVARRVTLVRQAPAANSRPPRYRDPQYTLDFGSRRQ
jgi:hypothetical protein